MKPFPAVFEAVSLASDRASGRASAGIAAPARSENAVVAPAHAGKRLAAIALVAVAAGCTTLNTTPGGLAPDSPFVSGAATTGANEIAAARVAQQKAADPTVRSYAARMIQDHTVANDQLKAIVGTKGVSVAATPDAEHVAAVTKLSAMSGAEFDRTYMQQQVVDHQKTVALFDTEADNGTDPDIRSFAATTLPILRQHLRMAQQWTSNGSMGTMTR